VGFVNLTSHINVLGILFSWYQEKKMVGPTVHQPAGVLAAEF
jgi:hypothetical protein